MNKEQIQANIDLVNAQIISNDAIIDVAQKSHDIRDEDLKARLAKLTADLAKLNPEPIIEE